MHRCGMIFLMDALRKLFEKFFCNHRWVYSNTVKEQNLRAGYKHWSEVYVCEKCGKHKTVELS